METNVKGMVEEMAGNAQAMAGDALGDDSMRLTGRAKALCGSSQRLAAHAACSARDTISENPLAMLGVALGLGFAVGALWASKHH